MPDDHFGDLLSDGVDRIQARHRLLKDHPDLFAAQIAHLGVAKLGDLAALKLDAACRNAASVLGEKAHDRQAGH